MTVISLDLSNRVPDGHVATIRRVLQTAASLNLTPFIVGAQARDLILQYFYELPVQRATTDFDFAFAAETWSEFEDLRDLLIAQNDFRRDPRKEHRLVDLDAGNQDRLYDDSGDCLDLLLEEDFDYECASARVLGRDVGGMLTNESYAVVDRLLAAEMDLNGPAVLLSAMIRNNSNYNGDFDIAQSRLNSLHLGITETAGS